ncbi:MAG: YfhO family protein [Solobacterium sp.]|nr:YfhO family protein [Solobacterium sp.]MDY2952091.1 YfhO family protein [Erysipelotrichaceae bacterium]
MNSTKKLRNTIIVGTILLFFSVAVFYKTLFQGFVFAWYNDQLFQHNVFYKEWHEIIRESISSHTLAIYSLNTFLGNDYLASKLMYGIGDFLITPFFIFYSGNINYDILFATTTIITIVLSGIMMLVFLDKYGIKKNYLQVIISIIYALGGFAMTYTGTYTFHRFYCLLPLLFYFCERYIQANKRIGFTLIVAILFLQSYELLFSTCFFLILYFIQSCKLRYRLSILDILKKAIPLIISFLIGIMLCGAFLLPLYAYIKNNPRVGSINLGSIVWNYKTIVSILSSFVVPAFNYRSGKPPYMFYENTHYGSEFGVYATVLFILAFIILYRQGNKEEKKIWFVGEVLIIICLLIKPINSIIHGFSVPSLRFIFLLEFYHLLVTAYVFEKYEANKYYFSKINVLYGIYIVIYLIFILSYKIDIKYYMPSILINILSFALLYIYSYLYVKNRVFMSVVIILNIMFLYVSSIYATYGIYGNGEESYNKEYLQYFIENDEDKMFRIYFDSEELWPYSWLNLNDSINSSYMSVTTYDSTYDSVLNNFLNSKGINDWLINLNDLESLKLLGVKYYITTSKLDDNYELISNLNNYNIYKINNYNHIGFTYEKFVKESDTQENNILEVACVKNDDYNKLKDIKNNERVQLEIVEYNRQYFKGKLNSGRKSLLFVSIPYSGGWNVVDQNGNKLETLNINGGFLGVITNEDSNEINFYYGTPYLKQGLLLSFLGVVLFMWIFIKDVWRFEQKD